ncbi:MULTISPECIES: hypothetical protein [Marivita]|uniref:Uncharacterized protein n=1 Tax=Marivita cryptomonadis TaxID=505252 RepID=A0A9Q2P5K7_9RHOB|nr:MULTISPECIES: hypothetical protein [Marivita]MCR9167932.1 hypothetical protein [Paracoccaceae bacterium]MBM2322695.1 hypothetical protein [Marivita cryptomonadis]MBM2332277.1 hypothetical protein [Marivita cryptomonadis]MBM2341861.1 hypothetical protein [Marivita cryptomonadis]MBM2346525.1 hypothetical protein [Marivita cryptomonadis]
MTGLERVQAMAREESDLARKRWDDPRSPIHGSQFERDLEKMLGSGITQAEAAERLGCARATISKLLKKKGWAL